MPSDIPFSKLKKDLEAHGWSLARIKGSHHYFTGPGRMPISIPVHKGKVKYGYKRQIDKAIRSLNRQEDSSQD